MSATIKMTKIRSHHRAQETQRTDFFFNAHLVDVPVMSICS